MKFEYTEVFNLEGALRGMRNPMLSHHKSDSKWVDGKYVVGENDFELGLRLAKAGSDHRKFMRQIFVSFDLTAPWYLFKEFSTYKVGVTQNSTSMMHKLGSRKLTIEDFGWDKMTEYRRGFLNHINRLIEQYIGLGNKIERMYDKIDKMPIKDKFEMRKLIDKEQEIRKKCWRELQQDMSGSYLYRRTITLNYEVLRNIYHSRLNHRLEEWRKFCIWIESLPHSELITNSK